MRCNVGINPVYLTDQWLIAEYRELPMVVGSFRVNGWKIKSEVKDTFNLGTGHINWFKPRLAYLHQRHKEVKIEMINRNFKCDALTIRKDECPGEFWNDWKPSMEDSQKIRERLVQKLLVNKLPISWWRWRRVNLGSDMAGGFLENIIKGELFYV